WHSRAPLRRHALVGRLPQLRLQPDLPVYRHEGLRAVGRHAGPPRSGESPPIPEPTYAERARTLAYLGRSGALATLLRKHPRHPFASVMPYALDAQGPPLLLIQAGALQPRQL